MSDATPRVPGSSHQTAALTPDLPPEVKDAAATPSNRFGKYVLVRELGHGGMGVVYLAWQSDLRRYVALKFIKGIEGSDDLARFEREARTAAALVHPNIVPVYEVGELDGKHYYSMMFVRGKPLDARLHSAKPPLRQAVQWIADALAAVHYANEQGVIHRDIKPANLMIGDDGRVYVMDFGLARWNKPGSSLTASGMAVGTPAYMSPEQAGGRIHGLDGRSDVYSFGATLYEALAGRPPFEGTGISIMMAVATEDPVPVRRLRPEAPADLEVVCQRAMDKDPGRRYGSCADFAADLTRWLDGEPILAKPAGTVSKIARRIRKHKLLSAAIAVAVVASFVGLGLFAYAQYAKRTAAESRAELGALQEQNRRLEAVRARVQGLVARIQRWDLYLYQPEFDISEKHGELTDVIRELESCRADGAIPEIDFAVGTALRRLGRHAEAVERFSAALAASPTLAPALYERGLARIELVPWRPAGLSATASASDLRRFEAMRRDMSHSALRDLEEAVRLKGIPDDDLTYARASVAFHLRQTDEAIRLCTDEINRGTRQADFYALRGRLTIGLAVAEARIADVRLRLADALADLAKATDIRRCDADLALHYVWLAEVAAWMDSDSGTDPSAWIDIGLRHAKRARTIRPRDPEPVLNELELLSHRLENELALGRPLSIDDLRSRLEEARKLGAPESTLLHCRALIELFDARVAMRDGKDPVPLLDRAITTFDEAARLLPEDGDVLAMRGAALATRMRYRLEAGADIEDDYRRAAADLDARLARAGGDYNTLSNRSLLHDTYAEWLVRSRRDPRSVLALAVADVTAAVEIYPDFAMAWANLGCSLLRRARWNAGHGSNPREDLDRAMAALDRSLTIDAKQATALGHRAAVALQCAELEARAGKDPGGLVEAALADLGRALDLEPANPDLLLTRGNLRFQLGVGAFESGEDPSQPLGEARADFTAVTKADPRNAVAWMNLGLVHQVLADWKVRRRADAAADLDAAGASFRRAVEINPGYRDARMNLAGTLLTRADLLLARGDDPTRVLEDAIAEYDGLIREAPKDSVALNDRGTARNRLGKWLKQSGGDPTRAWTAAETDFTAATDIDPANWRALLNRSNARKYLGRYADAADDIEAAIAINAGLERSQRSEVNRLRRLAEKEK